MWLLDKMLRRVITKGELVVTDHDGRIYRYGAPDPAIKSVHARLTDRKAAFHIAKDPRLGAGEAYMDGRVVIEPPADIRDLIMLIRYNAPAEKQGALKPKGPLRKSLKLALSKIDQVNWKARSRRNAEHAYNLTRELYELFLDEDRQYTMAYYRDPATFSACRSIACSRSPVRAPLSRGRVSPARSLLEVSRGCCRRGSKRACGPSNRTVSPSGFPHPVRGLPSH